MPRYVCFVVTAMALMICGCSKPAPTSSVDTSDMMPDIVLDMMSDAAKDQALDSSSSDMEMDLSEADHGMDMKGCARLNCPELTRCASVNGVPYCAFSPLEPCQPDQPCTRTRSGQVISQPTDIPTCQTPEASKHPFFDDSPAIFRTDSSGVTRYGCLYKPNSAPGPLPLVIFLHGGSGNADNLYGATSLRQKAQDYDLTGEPGKKGFVLLSLQARNVHYPYGDLYDNTHFDSLTWDVERNMDVENIDAWIDQLVGDGSVDANRIYLFGWSEGGLLAQVYGLLKPGRVASLVIYSATKPFERNYNDQIRIELPTLPTSTLPIYGVSRTCDGVACSEAHRTRFQTVDDHFVDTVAVETWTTQLANDVQNPNVTWTLVDDQGAARQNCALTCSFQRGAINHIKWPDGVNGSVDQEPGMLDFCKNNPR